VRYYLQCFGDKSMKKSITWREIPEWGDGPDRLVSRHISYNIFQYEDFKSLLDHRIKKELPQDFKGCGYFIRGWINRAKARRRS
jgi:hypothetical protein